jgi:hypothetical protein
LSLPIKFCYVLNIGRGKVFWNGEAILGEKFFCKGISVIEKADRINGDITIEGVACGSLNVCFGLKG